MRKTIVGAHYGLKEWMLQRATAVVMAIFIVYTFFRISQNSILSFEDWRLFFKPNAYKAICALFFLSIFYHVWVGVRDIFMDYIKPLGIRLLLQSIIIAILMFYSFWALFILWRA